ncbi:MAG TPA: cupin domain-containing protein [Xanthobacteraceae bacterium]|jgi:mannose-6-phosphate isomerase-like protein (cupin superfamily)|nr:cupin domain-containing protein [Xanthobacteraceae bacterium]
MKSVRRIVTIDDDEGKSVAIADGPTPDVQTDPARPGFSAEHIWTTTSSPPQIGEYRDAVLVYPRKLEPPQGGSVCRVMTFPPDSYSKISAADVAAYFHAAGSPAASTFSANAPHPYMQKTQTLDFCLVLEGEITLILDTAEVDLKTGDTVVQRGTNHAWSNRSNRPCRIAISSHDAVG